MAMEIGVTGGIGSGKSTVVGLLQHCLGYDVAAVIDADAVSRSVTAPNGAAVSAVRQAFGAAAIDADGGMDRAYMRQLLASDEAAREQLEAITHPVIRRLMDTKAADSTRPVILFDVPLLVESGAAWLGRVDMVFVVDCPVETQIQRVRSRPGSADWSLSQIHNIIALQASRRQRREAADAVIDNGQDTTLELLRDTCEKLCASWFSGMVK